LQKQAEGGVMDKIPCDHVPAEDLSHFENIFEWDKSHFSEISDKEYTTENNSLSRCPFACMDEDNLIEISFYYINDFLVSNGRKVIEEVKKDKQDKIDCIIQKRFFDIFLNSVSKYETLIFEIAKQTIEKFNLNPATFVVKNVQTSSDIYDGNYTVVFVTLEDAKKIRLKSVVKDLDEEILKVPKTEIDKFTNCVSEFRKKLISDLDDIWSELKEDE
jgi:hypothetical protein